MEKKISQAVFGKRNCEELLKRFLKEGRPASEWPYREFLIRKNPSRDLAALLENIPEEIHIRQVSIGDFDSMFPGMNHQGVAFLKKTGSSSFEYSDIEKFFSEKDHEKPVLILDRIQDVGNFGSIIRTAECLGVKHIIIPERDSAMVNDTVMKTSSGAVHHVNIYRVTNLSQILDRLKENGFWIASASDRGSENWEKISGDHLALILGSEGEGVKRILMEKSDYSLRIPMHGKISSMNVSVACGILLDRIVNRS